MYEQSVKVLEMRRESNLKEIEETTTNAMDVPAKSIREKLLPSLLAHITGYRHHSRSGNAGTFKNHVGLPFPGSHDRLWADDDGIRDGLRSHERAEVG